MILKNERIRTSEKNITSIKVMTTLAKTVRIKLFINLEIKKSLAKILEAFFQDNELKLI